MDYTRLGECLAPEDIGHIAGRLVEICTQVTIAPVTLVKTIGDAAMSSHRAGRILATEEIQTQVPERDWKRTRRVRSLKGISDRIRLYSLASDSAMAST